jgi:hypothetical protein|tara:strand:- start:243 stop:362 length:120 start_codon:yes stop_codon:yes gene_type:complete
MYFPNPNTACPYPKFGGWKDFYPKKQLEPHLFNELDLQP